MQPLIRIIYDDDILCVGLLTFDSFFFITAAGISSMRSNKNCCNDFKIKPINKKNIASINKIPLYCKQYGFK